MWSRRSIEVVIGTALFAALTACSVTPKRTAEPVRTAVAAAHPAVGGSPATAACAARAGTARTRAAQTDTAQTGAAQSGVAQTGASQCAAAPAPIPPEAQAEFDKALALARAGNDSAAEAQLTSLSHQYTRFSTPLLDLGILYRKGGHLDSAAQALHQAVARDPHSAPAWTELGVIQRLGGRFQDADQSYTRAIAADPTYAPAYRDRGVLRDLYLDQPAAALGDLEQYRKLAAQDKPVVMWIAELQHRTGIKQPPGGEHPGAATAASAPSSPAVAAAPTPPPQARN